MRTIVIQGAVINEINLLITLFPNGKWSKDNGYSFYEASLNKTRIVISLTQIGIINACISTMIAIEKYHPVCIINQGTAGGHKRDIKVGDIIIGESDVYINNMRSPLKGKGEGSNSLEWWPGRSRSFDINADTRLIELTKTIPYDGRIILGKLGSGDLFSRETDRIDWMHSQLGELCEDMESIAVYKACIECGVPVIGIRIISNNEITGENDNDALFDMVHNKLQNFIFEVIKLIENEFE
ncbi:MAG TPA: 5'-methylthioadenosine/S-adenosylhomocysteine nucleosidase [Caproicibacter sp.]|nr:5'-methylthioadenosine/S-adenosylhomocysteine nucleosidase [Caproicibacter sp.]